MIPRGRGYRYPPGRNMPDGPIPGGMLPVAYDMSGMHFGQPLSTGALASSLANASPAQQRTVSLSQHINSFKSSRSVHLYSVFLLGFCSF